MRRIKSLSKSFVLTTSSVKSVIYGQIGQAFLGSMNVVFQKYTILEHVSRTVKNL